MSTWWWLRPIAFACGCALVAAGTPVAAAGFVANEAQASAQKDLLDAEYSQSRGQVTWVDVNGRLWVANVDRQTGLIRPADGKGMLVDAAAMTSADLKTVGNGPEWLFTAGRDQIVYTRFLDGLPHTLENARLAVAGQSATGDWQYRVLGDLPRNAPYSSQDPGDPAPRISYVDAAGNHYWREVNRPNSETVVGAYPPSKFSMRFVRGARAVVFLAPDAFGHKQVFRYWLDTQVTEQITDDGGHDSTTNVPWMWQAPEYAGDFVLAVLSNNDTELRLYRQSNGPGTAWRVVHSVSSPQADTFGSHEPFVHNGRSYVFFTGSKTGDTFPSRILLSGIDPAAALFLQLTPELADRSRKDPEVFITDKGPYIYFNRIDRSKLPPGVPIGSCLACSEGVFFSDTGLGPPSR